MSLLSFVSFLSFLCFLPFFLSFLSFLSCLSFLLLMPSKAEGTVSVALCVYRSPCLDLSFQRHAPAPHKLILLLLSSLTGPEGYTGSFSMSLTTSSQLPASTAMLLATSRSCTVMGPHRNDRHLHVDSPGASALLLQLLHSAGTSFSQGSHAAGACCLLLCLLPC